MEKQKQEQKITNSTNKDGRRGFMMVHLAVGSDAIVLHKHQKPHQNLMISKNPTATSRSRRDGI